jgi:VWA domain-containing protein
MFHKPRPLAVSLALLLLVAISSDSSPAQSKPPDFSGFWLRDDGGIIKISVIGTNVKAVHVKVVPENRSVYGFVPGDTHFEGTARGRTFTGKVMGHLAVAKWKKLCPGRWASWADNELTLSEDGTTLAGRWKHLEVSDKDCSIIKEEWLPAKYVRSPMTVSAAQGQLKIVGRGNQLSPLQLELILDASGSMWEKVQGRPKITTAKEVTTQIIQELPEDSQVALRIYGHRIAPGRRGACQDSELVFPFAKIDKPRLIQRIRGIRALGTTPIAYSLRQVADDFGGAAGEKMVVLVSDGIEECRGSPSAEVSELLAKGVEVRVNVVGFALADNASKMEMQRIAELSRGRFFDAKNARGLRDAILGALAVPYDVLDASDVSVGAGLVDQAAIQVPEGTYKILVHVPGAPITIQDVQVAHDKSTTVELGKEHDKIVSRVLGPS